MLPYLFAALGGYLIGDSINKQYADGGLIVRSRIASIIGIDKALKYLDKDYVVSPFSLIESAVRKGFITIDEINKNLWDEAVIEAEDIEESYRDSGHGIGSSDMNAFISRMLNAAGIKVGVIDNKYTRLADGGETIGFIPYDLEEDLAIIAKWGGTNIKGVIGFLNAMIDSGLTDEDLKPNPTNTRIQREKAEENKIQEIWKKIQPNYKGGLKGNMYYSTIKRLVQRSGTDDNILKRFKPFRKHQMAAQ
jgi:hypothetical protein